MKVLLYRAMLALFIGALSFGTVNFVHMTPVFASDDEGEGEEEGGEESSDGESDEGSSEEEGEEESEEEEPKSLTVKLKVDSSKVNKLVQDRYKIYVKPDPKEKSSKRFLFDLEKKKITSGDLELKGVTEAKTLQVKVAKDNYYKDCNPSKKVKSKMAKDSVIKKMPKSVIIKLEQEARFLKERNIKKLSGANGVPNCTIVAIR